MAIAGSVNDDFAAALDRGRQLELIGEPIVRETAIEAVEAVRDGRADVLIKGSVDTRTLMRAVLDPDKGLRTGSLISHVAVLEAAGRLLLVTDSGICINPTLDEKVEILRNALPVAHRLGFECPKVAVLAMVESVNPEMPETVDADALSKMDIPGCVVQGPLALDLAVSKRAAETKNVTGPVAGQADILLVPSVLVGNIFCKGIVYFAASRFGGVVAGTSHPVAFLSRSDNMDAKLNTIALGILLSRGE